MLKKPLLFCFALVIPTIFSDDASKNILMTDHITITPLQADLIQYHYSVTKKILTPIGADEASQYEMTYFPEVDTFKILTAEIIDSQNQKKEIPAENMSVKQSSASQEAPGFTNSLTLNIQFPQLQPGETVKVKSNNIEKLTSKTAFSPTFSPDPNNPTHLLTVEYQVKPFFPVYYASSKEFIIEKNQDTLTASLQDLPALVPEVDMVDTRDVLPYFSLSSIKSWAEYGKILWNQFKPVYKVTPTIQALANDIAGKSTGLEAAKKLYQWEIDHIHYVAIYLDQSAEMIPNAPDTILQRGYGDCKDYATLLCTLLMAKGIDAKPAIVNWSFSYRQYPIPSNDQFNHAILYLPHYHLFLNPTDKHSGFGDFDASLADKPVLVIGDDAKFIRTQDNPADKNGLELQSEVTLDAQGNFQGHSVTDYFGYFNTIVRGAVLTVTSGTQLANTVLAMTFYGGSGNITWSDPNNILKDMQLKGEWRADHAILWRDKTDIRFPEGTLLFNINQLKSSLLMTTRHYPMVAGKRLFKIEQTLIIPKEHHFSMLPPNITFKNKIGEYKVSYKQDQNQLKKSVIFSIQENVVAAKDYPLYVQLIETALQDQHAFIEIT